MSETQTKQKYFFALGRRKTAIASVRIFEGTGESTINGNPVKKYYASDSSAKRLAEPFTVTENVNKFFYTAKTKGGGAMGQLDAIVLGIARALVKFDETLKPVLRKHGLLTRDTRMVERKKTGLHKARKKEQYSKR